MENSLSFLLEDLCCPSEGMEDPSLLDQLAEGKLSWENFLQKHGKSLQRFSHVATTKHGHSLMHLAVLAHRSDCMQMLLEQKPHLKYRKNGQGFTPIDLAKMLSRETMLRQLGITSKKTLSSDPFLSIEEPDHAALGEILYLEHPVFASAYVLAQVIDWASKAKHEDLIPTERIWMGVYLDHELFHGLHPKVTLRWIDKKMGFGIFANQKIPPCSLVGEYTGYLGEMSKEEVSDKRYCAKYAIWGVGKSRLFIDAEKMGNFTRFINHSAKPNLAMQSVYWRGIPRMACIALDTIHEGTELTLDYGNTFWKHHPA